MRISTFFVHWKIRCKCVFENEDSSLSTFCHMWRDEVCIQLLAKGCDAKLLELDAYSDFISALIALRKRI
jgi:hypothetical protein